jgi:hypothetical protein
MCQGILFFQGGLLSATVVFFPFVVGDINLLSKSIVRIFYVSAVVVVIGFSFNHFCWFSSFLLLFLSIPISVFHFFKRT